MFQTQFQFKENSKNISLLAEDPKFKICCTHGHSRISDNFLQLQQERPEVCWIVGLLICSGMGATNFIFKAPTDFNW